MKQLTVLDFETDGIEDRPDYPPVPAGCALIRGREKDYLSWGHPTGNNITKSKATKYIKDFIKNDICIFHNAAFDLAVAIKHLGCKMPYWQDYHDTMFLAFLHNPHEVKISLKDWSEKYLGIEPEERDMLKEWIIEHIYDGKKDTKANPWGAHIAEAPGDVVAPYAIGDVERTLAMFEALLPDIQERNMMDAYDRERKVMPIFESMSEGGIAVVRSKLRRDLGTWEKDFESLESKIKRRLKVGKDFDIGSSKQLADALDKTGKMDHWELTPKGNRSTKRDLLIENCNDKLLVDLLARRGVLNTYITTFGHPWLEKSKGSGYIYPSFNQVRNRSDEQSNTQGTRTGRPSSTNPNLLNVPKDAEDGDKPWTAGLPKIRDYLKPDKGCSFLNRDYNQQELRILAHMAGGELEQRYNDDPWLDIHTYAQEIILQQTGILYPRKHIKVTSFGILYGMGVGKLAKRLGITDTEASKLKKLYLRALSGINDVSTQIKGFVAKDEPIVTWGGREYFVEEPKLVSGRLWKFDYKLLNYLIQGSAADCTKQAMINVSENCNSRIVLQVYDELMLCADLGEEKQEMKRMREAMEAVEFDVPLLSEGKRSATSWGACVNWEGVPR